MTVVCLILAEVGLPLLAPVDDPYFEWKNRQWNRFIRSEHLPNQPHTVRAGDVLAAFLREMRAVPGG